MPSIPFRRSAPFAAFIALLFNPVTFGFFLSLYYHSEEICDCNDEFMLNPVTIFTYFWGAYFTIHVITWFVVFSFLYQNAIVVGLEFLIDLCNWDEQRENMVYLMCDLFYGYWVGGEILGGWCDLERVKDCVQYTREEERLERLERDEEVICDSLAITYFTRCVQSLCERLTYFYDVESDSYQGWSLCMYLFRYLGHLIMTLLSSLFTILLIFY